MDSLSSLSSGLPRRATIQQELQDLDTNLICEFKSAASAVTKLFKLAGAKTSLARDQGYIDALQDLLDALDEDATLDAKSWALQRLLSLSPEEQRRNLSLNVSTPIPTNEQTNQHINQASQESTQTHLPTAPAPPAPPSGMFTFQSHIAYPTELPDQGSFEVDLEDLMDNNSHNIGDKRRSGHRLDFDYVKRLKRNDPMDS
jgi:hypothetical protein